MRHVLRKERDSCRDGERFPSLSETSVDVGLKGVHVR